MPKPENFDKLTPDQKRQARLDAWINHEGLEFTSPEAEKGTGNAHRCLPTSF